MALALNALGFLDAGKADAIDVTQFVPHILCEGTLNATRETMFMSEPVDDTEIAAVAARQNPSFMLKGGFEGLAAVGTAPKIGDELSDVMRMHAALGLLHLGLAWRALRTHTAVTFDVGP